MFPLHLNLAIASLPFFSPFNCCVTFSGVPYVQGSTPSMAGSVPSSNFAGTPPLAPSNAPSAAQPVSFENQSYSWTNQPAPHSAQPTGTQSHIPREQEYPGKQHHHR